MSRHFFRPKMVAKSTDQILEHIEHDFDAGPDAIQLNGSDWILGEITAHQDNRSTTGSGEHKSYQAPSGFPEQIKTEKEYFL